MLLTKKPHINVPSLFHHWHENDIQLSEDFYECISECYAAIEKKNFYYITKIVDLFYTKWIESPQLSEKLKTELDQAITTALSAFIMVHLAVELAYVSHYSLSVACGLTLLFIRVGIKITTPEWSTVGVLSGGFFKYRILKTSPAFKNSRRM